MDRNTIPLVFCSARSSFQERPCWRRLDNDTSDITDTQRRSSPLGPATLAQLSESE
jgi:hypothetical protein